MSQNNRYCVLDNQAIVNYSQAWDYQRSLVEERVNDASLNDVLILLEHPPVYTLGTGSSLDFLNFDPQAGQFEIHRIERGGEVTYHCPGQLVGYPIMNLRYYQQDLHWYLRQLEAVIINTVANYGLSAYRVPDYTGVWLEGKKIAAIGIKVRRWITMHGFAINVCPDMSGFKRIVPCGIADKPVGSLQEFVPDLTVDRVRIDVAQAFAAVFQIELVEQDVLNQVK
ncbi:MAG: lipoyl(octanoyl) transferase LipB [Pleurocapsa minor HA4230-MV1]|jgi:lipoyl(octanoyl) transferase|nr:lipoyl(octanoyl) transferase LipB [Pleurocapsa minor HA4230-MV1]